MNVGGGPSRDLPVLYKEYKQVLLDIDPDVHPDICLDARKTNTLPKGKFDAVFCSHTLEHFYKHEHSEVLSGFHHVLRQDGFAHIIVPNVDMIIEHLAGGKDIDDAWYHIQSGPITYHEALYGWNQALARGNTFYAHKSGFTKKALGNALGEAGFASAVIDTDLGGNLFAYAFKKNPTPRKLKEMGLAG